MSLPTVIPSIFHSFRSSLCKSVYCRTQNTESDFRLNLSRQWKPSSLNDSYRVNPVFSPYQQSCQSCVLYFHHLILSWRAPPPPLLLLFSSNPLHPPLLLLLLSSPLSKLLLWMQAHTEVIQTVGGNNPKTSFTETHF